MLTRVALGARVSIFVAFTGVGIATGIGVPLGAIAGYYEGWLGEGIMRVADMVFTFPALLLALALVTVLGQSKLNVLIAMGLVYWPVFARITRGSVLSVKEEDFVQAARAIGEQDTRIIFSEILPNVLAPIIVQATISLAVAVLVERALVSRARRPAAGPVLGAHAVRQPQLHDASAVVGDSARCLHHADRVEHQLHRRRTQRRTRPPTRTTTGGTELMTRAITPGGGRE
ncbi:ABC transporter permease [Halobacteriaceae archaeon GCM10025711]